MAIYKEDLRQSDILTGFERALMRKYGLRTVDGLYEVIRHADFHLSGKDAMDSWGLAQYAAFSGKIVGHRLSPEAMLTLWQEHQAWRESHPREWSDAVVREIQDESGSRTLRDYHACAHRYCCRVLGKYTPPAGVMEKLAELDRKNGVALE
jgi:hypothetical protein